MGRSGQTVGAWQYSRWFLVYWPWPTLLGQSWNERIQLHWKILEVRLCYGLIVCVPLKFICWDPNPQYDILGDEAFCTWLDHEGGVLMNGISAFIKEAQESSLTPSTMWEHSKQTDVYEPGSRPSPDTESSRALILDFLDSRTVRNKFPSFKSYPVCSILLRQPEWTNIVTLGNIPNV